MPDLAVILPAAGKSTRFGGGSKLLATLGGEPVITHALRTFLAHPAVKLAVLPTGEGGIDLPAAIAGDARVTTCRGGATRAESVRNGCLAVPAGIEWVAVHDAARPLVSRDVIDRTLAAAVTHGAAAPALPVALTVKQATGPLPAVVERTVPRQNLWAMQTPQIARRAALLDAFDRCPVPLADVTDDVQLIELAGGSVCLVSGDERNLKITTALDLRVAELLLSGA